MTCAAVILQCGTELLSLLEFKVEFVFGVDRVLQTHQLLRKLSATFTYNFRIMLKKIDNCNERWWQGVGVVEAEPTAKVLNAKLVPSGISINLPGMYEK